MYEPSAFLDAVNTDDVMTRFVRLHQFLDNVLTELVNERLVESHALEVKRIPFALRVELAVALGIIDMQTRSPLLQFNSLRNDFVHTTDVVLTEKHATDFYNIFPPQLRESVSRNLANETAFHWRITLLVVALFVHLHKKLDHIRDMKIWDEALHEEVQDILSTSVEVRAKYKAETDAQLKARFDRLKAKARTTPDAKNAP
jgi:hypothetical protein